MSLHLPCLSPLPAAGSACLLSALSLRSPPHPQPEDVIGVSAVSDQRPPEWAVIGVRVPPASPCPRCCPSARPSSGDITRMEVGTWPDRSPSPAACRTPATSTAARGRGAARGPPNSARSAAAREW